MAFIFSPVDRAMLGKDVRYLERGCMTSRKFFRGMENQVFLEKMYFFTCWRAVRHTYARGIEKSHLPQNFQGKDCRFGRACMP